MFVFFSYFCLQDSSNLLVGLVLTSYISFLISLPSIENSFINLSCLSNQSSSSMGSCYGYSFSLDLLSLMLSNERDPSIFNLVVSFILIISELSWLSICFSLMIKVILFLLADDLTLVISLFRSGELKPVLPADLLVLLLNLPFLVKSTKLSSSDVSAISTLYNLCVRFLLSSYSNPFNTPSFYILDKPANVSYIFPSTIAY